MAKDDEEVSGFRIANGFLERKFYGASRFMKPFFPKFVNS
jgi:hypothetical protein